MNNRLVHLAIANLLTVIVVLIFAGNSSAFTQREFAHLLVSRSGWSDGLPKVPTDRDYLVILGGKRTFRYEAESYYNASVDNVVLRNYPLYGQFSGTGWLMGTAGETSASFRVMVPFDGVYSLKALIKGSDFVWQVEETVLRGGNPTGTFREVDLGAVTLKPGEIRIKVTLPPDGGVDAFILAASDLVPLQPMEGWRFNSELTALQMAQVGVTMMDAYRKLPPASGNRQIIAVVDAAKPAAAATSTRANYLGAFKSRAWLRAGAQGAELQIPLNIPETGYYELQGRMLGERLSGDISGATFSVTGKPYLESVNLGVFRLERGEAVLNLKIPPMGGIDTLDVTGRSMAPLEVMRAAGVEGPPERLVTMTEAESYVAAILGKFPVRK